MDNRPIGVLDSGMGGLTAVRELLQVLPHEDIVYFGDTGRVPYGTRSAEIVTRYALQDINFLLGRQVKMVIAACGTVTTTLPSELTDRFDFPYTGVLHPTVRAALRATRNRKIGVIATATTIRTGAYERELCKLDSNVQVFSKACPLFVPLVENGYTQRNNPVTSLVASEYLLPLKEMQIDTLILGCTHYPVLAPIIGDIMGTDVTLIDSGKAAADYAKELLLANNFLSDRSSAGKCSYFVSDAPEDFTRNASIFLGEQFQGQVSRIEITNYPDTIS
ncbi:MAG: glutamate racemase [Candidatus Merdivicinus sp.]|jgi:glutamate racemase